MNRVNPTFAWLTVFSLALTASMLASLPAEESTEAPGNQPETKAEKTPANTLEGPSEQTEPTKPEKEPSEKSPRKEKLDKAETLQRILEKLETISRDPFAPSDAITREQMKKNDRFVPVENSTLIPTVELVSYAEVDRDGKIDSLAGLRIDARIFFVRAEDQITIRSSGKNVVIQIETIENGRVEIKIGELSQTVIVR